MNPRSLTRAITGWDRRYAINSHPTLATKLSQFALQPPPTEGSRDLKAKDTTKLVKVTRKWKLFIRLIVLVTLIFALHRSFTGKSELFPEQLRAFMDETGLGQDAASEELHQRRIVSIRLTLAASILSVLSFFLLRERQQWLIVAIGDYLILIVSVILAIISYIILNNNGYGPGGFPF